MASAQTLTTLVNFNGANGASPGMGTLTVDHDGNLWGATSVGGTNNLGTVFMMTPGGTLTTVYNFGSTPGDSEQPLAPPIFGADGNLYGTAFGYYFSVPGIVYKLTPSGTLTVLHTFPVSYDGSYGGPNSQLTLGADGNFYGTYWVQYYGMVYKITPDGTFTNLYTFSGPDGRGLQGGLVQGIDGYFYGTTGGGGAYDGGTIFKISSTGSFTSIYSIGPNPGDPAAAPMQAKDGNFYGTIQTGGSYGDGTIYKMTPDGTVSTLYDFAGGDGHEPQGPLVQGTDGSLYGPNAVGGAYGYGNIFKITTSGTLTVLHDFDSTDGSIPQGGLVQHPNGQFYGFTYEGGTYGLGTVFTLALGPVVSLSAPSLSFGNQQIGSPSAPQTVTVTNNGAATLSISTVTVGGTNASDFLETDTCTGAMVAPNGTCTVNVTFTPTATGTRTGALTITDNNNGVGGSQQVISLTGTGTNPEASLSPTSLAFSYVVINTNSAPMRVNLKSTGTTNLNIYGLTMTGANAGDFTQTNNCPSSLAPGTNCILNVTFTPSTLAAESATLNVIDDATASPQTVALSGTGGPAAVLSPASGTFGTMAIGVPSPSRNLTLQNNQSVALNISGITLNNPDFTETNTCGSSVAAKGSCTISVTLTPSILGAETATLTVNDGAASPYNALSSSLSGTGIAQTTVGPTSLTFAPQTMGTASGAITVTLKNNLLQPLTFNSITITGADPGDFAQANTCGNSVAANSGCVISVTFEPTATGSRTATLSLNDGANNSPQTVSLAGTGR